jgi:cytochrome c
LKASLSKTNGKAPLEVVFDASESFDYDGDKLYFNWEIDDKKFKDTIISYVFEKEGVYYPELILRDQKGNKQRMQFVVEVGNEAPNVSLNMEGNRTFFWKNRAVKYNVAVSDTEDGVLGKGISPDDVSFDIEYYQSMDKAETLGHQKPVSNGLSLIESLDCKGCHMLDGPSIGPSYQEVSQKYKNTKPSDYLSDKIINGGGGVWGEQAMSAHPELSKSDATAIVNYILSLANQKTHSLSGSYTTDQSSGRYLFHASYQDQGKKPLRPTEGVESVWLRPNRISATDYDFFKDVSIGERANRPSVVKDIYNGSYIGFRDIDLTEIGAIRLHIGKVRATLDVVARAGKPDGKELGRISIPVEQTNSCCLDIPIDSQERVDIYFVFENPNEENRLMDIEELEFLPKKE